jgi:hypothetical protein
MKRTTVKTTQFSNWTFGGKKVKALTFMHGNDVYTTYHKCIGDGWDNWESNFFYADDTETFLKRLDDKNVKFVNNDGRPVDVVFEDEDLLIRSINKYLGK